MKKHITPVIVAAAMVISAAAPAFAADTILAKATSSSVSVNGVDKEFEAYNINDFNYFKLRDIAAALEGTEKSFEIDFNEENSVVTITLGNTAAEEVTAEELPAKKDKEATAVESTLVLGENTVSLTAYNIDGFNYLKLRDISEVIDFGVDFDAETNKIEISTTKGYGDKEDPETPVTSTVAEYGISAQRLGAWPNSYVFAYNPTADSTVKNVVVKSLKVNDVETAFSSVSFKTSPEYVSSIFEGTTNYNLIGITKVKGEYVQGTDYIFACELELTLNNNEIVTVTDTFTWTNNGSFGGF